ncbi:MAG: hypothetical protein ACE5FL_15500 [Myxococcota bacterium]
MSFAIVSYVLVIGTLAGYGWWVQSQRRHLSRSARRDESRE